MQTLLCLLGSLVLAGFFTGIELAFNSANRLNIELKKKQGHRSGIILSRFMDNPATFISTCLIGYIICLVLYGILFSIWVSSSVWYLLHVHINNPWVKLLVNSLLATLLALVVSEFLPRAVFRRRNDSVLIFFAPVANLFYNLFHPLATFLVATSSWVLENIFNIRVKEKSEAFAKVDLENFLQQSREVDDDNVESTTDLIENALSLPSVKIRQCLVPRTEIDGIDMSATIEEVRQHFIETKLSKMVVYQDNIDNIMGYIHQLDLFKKPKDIQAVLLPIPVVPESMSAPDLISKFSKERKTIAWVVDEFGGTAGIVTMEDVLEKLFGDIKDEYDTEETDEQQLSEHEYELSGRLTLDHLAEKYDLSFPENDSETLSGYIINAHKGIPTRNERIILDHYEFEIKEVSDTRIETVKMKVLR
ncbi:magnesium and cobalt efflux protein CorC [Filimonas lacunae]|nr:magnesium and cobalt efflux protein CorC [Filimonas lacunae]